MTELKIKASEVRGFNYHPSFSHDSLEDWLLFDEAIWRRELTIGKQMFPKMNTIRIWLYWDAFCRLGNEFTERVGKAIKKVRKQRLYMNYMVCVIFCCIKISVFALCFWMSMNIVRKTATVRIKRNELPN